MNKLTLFFIFIVHFMHAANEEIDISQPIRISQLIPRDKYFAVLAIEPAIPKNFVAVPGEEFSGWIYWGPKETITEYLEDQKSLSVPILRFRTASIIQDDKFFNVQKFKEEFKGLIDSNQESDFHTGKWGSYPYITLVTTIENKRQHFAWVGLNETNGAVLFFQLVEPNSKEGKQNGEILWNTFLKKTRELPFPLFIKAHGQEMQSGYTIVDIVGRKIKVLGEQRKADGICQFAVIPLDDSVEFEYKNDFKCFMEANWHFGDPLIKIEGSYIVDKGWVYCPMTTSVFIKEVDEFTDTSKISKNVFVKQIKTGSSKRLMSAHGRHK